MIHATITTILIAIDCRILEHFEETIQPGRKNGSETRADP